MFSNAAQATIEDERGKDLVDSPTLSTGVMSDTRPSGGIEGEGHLDRDRRGVSRQLVEPSAVPRRRGGVEAYGHLFRVLHWISFLAVWFMLNPVEHP